LRFVYDCVAFVKSVSVVGRNCVVVGHTCICCRPHLYLL